MNKEEKYNEIQKYNELSARKWDDIKDPGTYDYRLIEYPFGTRKVAIASDRTKILQAARGQAFGTDINSYESYVEKYKKDSNEFHEFDKFRALEILSLQEKNHLKLDKEKFFYEYGFRSTAVLSFWKNYFNNVKGCDVVNPCINASRDLGYDTELIDLNMQVPNLDNVGLLGAYHVLEHLSDPFDVIKRTYDALPYDAIFHVEIPIEPDGPRIRYGHLFPFHTGDLYSMLIHTGFQVIGYTDKSLPGGPAIERAVAIKKG